MHTGFFDLYEIFSSDTENRTNIKGLLCILKVPKFEKQTFCDFTFVKKMMPSSTTPKLSV
jgi:hypothetical protein